MPQATTEAQSKKRAIAEFWNCLAYCSYRLYAQAIYEKLEDITKK
ncbi:hypothetical protein [Nostoc sp. CHAB 5715]|nr:hypothetical protein [Nostoc sp. CHAB 5715]